MWEHAANHARGFNHEPIRAQRGDHVAGESQPKRHGCCVGGPSSGLNPAETPGARNWFCTPRGLDTRSHGSHGPQGPNSPPNARSPRLENNS
eukprot:8991259-Pyramimonas_sp.AAC.1